MIKCLYCEAENPFGEEFCEECGRPLKKTKKKKKNQRKYEKTYPGKYIYISATNIIVKDDCGGYLAFPDTQLLKDEKWELSFSMSDGCNLVEYLLVEEHQNVKEFISIERQILHILEEVQCKG